MASAARTVPSATSVVRSSVIPALGASYWTSIGLFTPVFSAIAIFGLIPAFFYFRHLNRS